MHRLSGHLSGCTSPCSSSSLPGISASSLKRGDEQPPARITRATSLLGLAHFGGCLAVLIAEDAGGLLHHLFTLTGNRRYVSVARSGRLPRPGGYPAKCSIECGLSSTLVNRAATTQPACGDSIIPPMYTCVNEEWLGMGFFIRSPSPMGRDQGNYVPQACP